jgi:hypothetical protein
VLLEDQPEFRDKLVRRPTQRNFARILGKDGAGREGSA